MVIDESASAVYGRVGLGARADHGRVDKVFTLVVAQSLSHSSPTLPTAERQKLRARWPTSRSSPPDALSARAKGHVYAKAVTSRTAQQHRAKQQEKRELAEAGEAGLPNKLCINN
jgi:hypothetical protein